MCADNAKKFPTGKFDTCIAYRVDGKTNIGLWREYDRAKQSMKAQKKFDAGKNIMCLIRLKEWKVDKSLR